MLDSTTIWPEDLIPLKPVGRLVLSKNIDNFFSENEQPALCCPWYIHYLDDKMLQARLSYGDAQKYRLGVNYLQLPVNAPKCPYRNNHFLLTSTSNIL